MAVINIELPLFLVAAAAVCALLVWLLGTFTSMLSKYRYRISLGVFFFALSGLMGFFSTLRLETGLFGDWFAERPISLLVGIAYCSYLLFGFLGCWTAVRVGSQMDRKYTLSQLYSALETRKKQDS